MNRTIIGGMYKTLLTPDLAKKLLEANTGNRPVNKSLLAMLCAAIEGGRWKYNGESIIISNTGRLIDGQHRCMAVVATGIAVEVVIVNDVEDDVFATIDSGAKRTGSDILSIEGVKNATHVAAALAIVDRVKRRNATIERSAAGSAVLGLLAAYPKIVHSVAFIGSQSVLCVPSSMLAALHYIFAEVDQAAADDFMSALRTGVVPLPADPMRLLMSRLLQNASAKAKLSKTELAALIVKTWNYRLTKQPLKSLRWRTREREDGGGGTEPFPEIVRSDGSVAAIYKMGAVQ
jgi:hypothetical protein